MRNPMIQAFITLKPRGKPLFTRYVTNIPAVTRSGTARGDPAPHFIVEVMGRRSRGDPGG